MGINTLTNKLKEDIVNVINECGLPAVNVLYVVKDVCNLVETEYSKALIAESQKESDKNGEIHQE